MNKKAIIIAPLAALVLTLLIGGIYKAKASNDQFSQEGDVLISYLGNSENVVIPDSVRKIGDEAFRGNTTMKSVSIPDSVLTIGYGAFAGCTALESVKIPDSVTVIEDSAFNGCSRLSELSIGKSLHTLGSGVFADCDSLSEAYVSPENSSFCSEDHALYNFNKTVLYQYFAGSPEQSYALPGTVADVKRYSFWGCDTLKQLTLTGMTKLPDYAIANADGLESVIISEPISEIGIGAFSGDGKLMQVELPLSVCRIHETAFEGCPEAMIMVCEPASSSWKFAEEHELATSEVPVYKVQFTTPAEERTDKTEEAGAEATSGGEASATQTSAGGNAEAAANADEQAGSLNPSGTNGAQNTSGTDTANSGSILLGGTQVVSDRAYVAVNMSVNGGNDDTGSDGSGNAGSSDVPENNGAPAVPEIADYAHYLDQTLDHYDFLADTGITRIGRFAFARTVLQSAVIPEGITEIGEGAFYHCDRLTEISIPSTVRSVGRNAFSYTPWYQAWLDDPDSEFLIVGDGVLIGYKGTEAEPQLPAGVKYVAEGVLGEE